MRYTRGSASFIIVGLGVGIATLLMPWPGSGGLAYAFHFPWDQGHDTTRPIAPGDKDNPPPELCRGSGGHPVDLKSGDFFHVENDFSIRGFGPRLSVVRTYHAQDRHAGAFGVGWHCNLWERAVVVTDGDEIVAIVSIGDGRRLRFVLQADGIFESPAGVHATLTGYADGSLQLRERDGTVRVYDSQGRLSRMVDRNENALALGYDETSFLQTVADASGRSLTFTKGPNGKVAQLTDFTGRAYQYGYDLSGRLVTVTDPLGNATTYAYDANHNMTSIRDARGTLQVVNVYDTQDRVSQQTLPDGGLFRFTYTSSSETRLTDPRGLVTIHQHTCCGQPARVVDALGRVTNYEWDADINLTASTDPRGNVTRMTYDGAGNLLTQTDALAGITTFTYEPLFNQVTTIQDPRVNLTQFEYDPKGNPASVIDTAGNRTQFTYESRGLLTAVKDPLGNLTEFTYDASGFLRTTKDPLGHLTQLEYDAVGNVIRSTDAAGRATEFVYDPLNRLKRVTDALTGVTLYDYDANGNLTRVTDAKGQVTAFVYDGKNRLIRVTDPLGKFSTYTYDRDDNLAAVNDRLGRTITFTYDNANQLIRKTLPSGEGVAYGYDLSGNLLSVADADSGLQFAYDALNQVQTGSTLATGFQPVVLLNHTYDPVGNRLTLTDPARVVQSRYDALNRLERVTEGARQVDYAYDSLSRRTRQALPNGLEAVYGYDAASQLLGVEHRVAAAPATVLGRSNYTYDSIGNRGTLTDLAGLHQFGYDVLNRLGSAAHPAASSLVAEAFAYDPVGNRVSSHLSATHAYDAANRLLEDSSFSYSYDFNGNVTGKTEKAGSLVTTYTYDAENHLTRVTLPGGQVVSYRYDGLGRRIEKSVGGTITRYVYDHEDILLEYDGANTLKARWMHGPGIDEPVWMERDLNGDGVFADTERFFYHADGLGSIVALTDSTGAIVECYRYDSFGNPTILGPGVDGLMDTGDDVALAQSAFGNPYLFTSREWDPESGFYYYRARYYDPRLGRFLQEDPIGILGSDLNFYAYVKNNPILFSDAVGLIVPGDPDPTDEIIIITAIVKEGPKLAQFLGQLGEKIVGFVKNTERIVSLTNTAKYRIPDIFNKLDGVLGEVKNVAKLSYTKQLQDFVAFTEKFGYKFELWVREGAKLSGPLRKAIEEGKIKLCEF